MSPISYWLAAFALANCLLVNLVLAHLPWQPPQIPGRPMRSGTTLDYTCATFSGIAHHDSWMPMRRALAYLEEPHRKGLYEVIFFEQRTKFQYPPTSLVLLEPLRDVASGQWLSDRVLNRFSLLMVALTAFSVGGILTLGITRLRSARGEPPLPQLERAALFALAALFTLTFYPLVRGYYLGQIQVWINALLAFAIWGWISGRRVVPGLLTGIACAIKPTFGLILGWSLLRREWRYAASFSLALAVVGACSVARYGIADHMGYLGVLSYIARHGESFYANQSINGLLHRLLGNGPNLTFAAHDFAPYHSVVYAGTALAGAALVGIALFRHARQYANASPADFCFALVAFTLASPIVWEHHYGVTLAAFAAAMPLVLTHHDASRRRVMLLLLGLSFAFISNSFGVLNRFSDTPWNFLESYQFFAGLLLLYVLLRLRRDATPLHPTGARLA